MQLLKSSQVHEWNRIPHVHMNYRANGCTYNQCLKSIITWHNETLSIWSMILVNIVSLVCLAYVVCVVQPTQLLPFILLYISTLVHLPFSVGYHLFIPISKETCMKWFKLDYCFIFVGITILIFAMCFFVLPPLLIAIITFVAIAISIYAIRHAISCKDKCKNSKNALLVSSITSLLLVPLVYQTIVRSDMFALAITIGIVTCLVFGAICYSTMFLNKFTPTFDLSHTIMHITVLIAHILEYAFIAHCYKTN